MARRNGKIFGFQNGGTICKSNVDEIYENNISSGYTRNVVIYKYFIVEFLK